jgi:hypothetical protein
MPTYNQNYFLAALAGILTGSLAILPVAAQSPSRKVIEDTARGAEARKLGSVLGIEVRTNAEHNVGRIADLLVNRVGQVTAAVVEFGGFLGVGTRKIAIEWSALRLEMMGTHAVAIMDIERDQLRAAPEYNPDKVVVVRKITQPAVQPEISANDPAAQPLAPQKKAHSMKRRRRPTRMRCRRY